MKHKATKRILSLLLAMVMLIGLLPTAAIPVFAVEESDGDVVEVSSWSEFEEAFALSDYSGKSYTVKLMNDLYCDVADAPRNATVLVEVDVYGCFVTLDFNGHTLSCTDMVSTTDVESPFSDFIRVNLHPINHNSPIEFILTDSAGGGGVTMNSHRVYDNQLAALHVYDTREYLLYGSLTQQTTYGTSKLTINGGNYTLNAKTEKFGNGTLTPTFNDLGTVVTFDYRGTVIADDLGAVEINGGTFTAKSDGVVTDFADMCARELSAFATCNTGALSSAVKSGLPVINGGTFISAGYSIHHFDRSKTLGEAEQELFPMINGGVFAGGVAYIGKTFTYSDGYEEYENKKTTDIINNDAYVICIKDGEKYGLEDDLDLRDLHDATSLYVFSGSLFDFKTTPEGEGDPTMLTRSIKQSDTFEMSWTVPESLTSTVVCQPTITITRPNSTIEPKTYSKSKVTVDYSEYPNDVNISCRLYVLAGGESFYFEQNYEVDVKRVYTATDGCIHCYAAGEDGWDEVVEGGSCSFKIYPKEYYELTDPDALEVYVNGDLVTPDANGVYTVENVTEDLDIYCDGSGFTSYSNLTVTANGKTVTEKIFNGGTYTFKTLDEFGATVPENSTFTGWKIGGKTYQPGETYTVPGGTEIAVNAVFTGLHTITVENGKAYADEAHTIPISAAAEDQVIYIVADPAPEGKVFGYWTEIEISSPGGDGWFGSYDSAQTTYKVYYSDVVLAPVYETQIDNIVINGMTKPSAGVAVDNSDYSYKWGCSVPANSGYSLGICYWYDITDGEPEFAMSDGDVFQIGHTYRFKAKINLYGDTILAAKEDISVALTGLDADSYTWTISEYSQIYENMVIYFEFTCEREEPDTSVERPEGSGTAGDPFKISTVGELYWFTGFTNNYVAVGEDFAVERNKAHAILMNDIIVNPELLTDSYGLNANSSLLADWSPICASKDSPYCGTFDGQGYSISGLYYNTKGYQHEYYGFIARMGENGAVKDLTLKDTYFYTEYTGNGTPYAAGIVAFAPEASNIIANCHFDGVVGTESSRYGGVAGGITAVIGGKIQDCTAKGRVIGADSYSGDNGKAGGIAGQAYVTAMISDCTNYAEVTCWDSGTGVGYAGGVAGLLDGTVKDCSNRGVINEYNQGNYNYVGGIVGWARGTAEQSAVISRCFNEASFAGSGIVDYIYSNGTYYEGYVTIKNCYNTGSVTNGIVGTAKGVGISITYCHNAGITTDPIIERIIYADDIEMANCYYKDDSETDDRMDGTTAMTSEQFSRQDIQMVTKLLNANNNGNWKQGDGYPILNKMFTLTVNNGTGSGTYGVDTEVTITATVPDGYVFAGWDGIDSLIVEAGQPARDTVATKFLMPKRDVTLTAKFTSIAPTRPEGRGTVAYPFQISTVGELYWFAGFVNGNITADDITVNPSKACAKLMNDITVNYELLKDDGTVNGSSGFAYWIPIGFYSNYSGTFDGQGYSISGLYHDMGVNSATVNLETTYYLGLFGVLGDGGIIRDLTVKDSYLGTLYDQFSARTGGIVASIDVGGTVKNCHFDGIVAAPNEENSTYILGGIAAVNRGDIQNCTSKGLITGYFYYGGGIVGDMVQGTVTDCVNESTVKTLVSGTGRNSNCSGGIVGTMATGTVRDCCNKGDVSGSNSGGIVGIAGWAYREGATILRCWNEGTVESGAGIAHSISGDNATIKNCYNTGSVRYGIVNSYTGDGHSVTYCHNVGELTAGFDSGAPIISMFNGGTGVEVANCYYLADSELDEIDGSTYKTATEFADGAVLALLNNGHWSQGADDDYPVLGDPPTAIRGTVTVSGTSATASVTVEELSGKAILIIAQYSGGQMQAAQTVSVKEDDTFAPDNPFTHANGCTYKAFLLDADTYAPLCAGAELGGI